MNRFFYILLFLFCSTGMFAQNITVSDFYLDEKDLTANQQGTMVMDQNGEKCALLRIQTTQTGFSFDIGSLGVTEIRQKTGEVWVYIPHGARKISIRHDHLGSLIDYAFPVSIDRGRTYMMKLTTGTVTTIVRPDVMKQGLQFKVSPANEKAVVKVKKSNSSEDYELWGEVDAAGTIDRFLDFGSYDYVVSAVNYESSYGTVNLANSQSIHVENVTLLPNFGFLEVGGTDGAQIYVDDVKIGTVPFKDSNKRWECGDHSITITNGDLYKTYSSSFTISKGQTTRIFQRLEANFAETTIRVNNDADIYVDDKLVGHGEWRGPLKAGRYAIVCKKDGHRESSRYIEVRADLAEVFIVDAPTPITGGIYVSSTPSGANVKIDGENKGHTPLVLQDLLIGSHQLELSLANHKTEKYTIEIKEGVTENVSATLSDVAKMTITSKPEGASLYLDGTFAGHTPFSKEMASGDYNIELKANKYKDYKERVHLDSSSPVKQITMTRQILSKDEFYLQPTVSLKYFGLAVAAGAYVKNINVEASYDMLLSSTETIYWNSTIDYSVPVSNSYRMSTIGGHVGYGIIIGSRFRITPQVGAKYVKFAVDEASGNKIPAFVVNANAAAKFEFAVLNNVGLVASADYSLPMKKSNYYNDITSVSKLAKDYSSGLELNVGVKLFF